MNSNEAFNGLEPNNLSLINNQGRIDSQCRPHNQVRFRNFRNKVKFNNQEKLNDYYKRRESVIAGGMVDKKIALFTFIVTGFLLAGNLIFFNMYKEALRKYKESLKQMEYVKEVFNHIKSYEMLNNKLIEKNAELLQENLELVEDNLELQNTLKMAASVGIKPQNYTEYSNIANDELIRGEYLGKFLGTAYTPSADECGNNMGITRSGEPIIPGVSVAVDNNYWPFGTIFYIKGLGYAVAMDTGGSIKGEKRFDFAVFDKKFALTLGKRYWDVYLVKMGDGKVDCSMLWE